MSRLLLASALFICLLGLLSPVHAQIPAARLEGTIQSAAGAPVEGVPVVATDERTGLSSKTQSDSAGHYIFPALPPGSYTLSVQASGYRPVVRTKVVLVLPASVTEDFTLEAGAPTEPINEEAARSLLRKSNAELAYAFAKSDLDILPQLNLDPLSLAVYLPGIQIDNSNPSDSNVNGNRRGSNNLTLDGMDVNDPVNPSLGGATIGINKDSISQFVVLTNAAKAEYGRNSGGQVMLDSLPGTKSWRGNAYEYFRDKTFNANDFFNNSSNVAKPRFLQNLYGASAGGPLIKDRTILFGNYEGRRTSRDIVRNRLVLTSAAKSGIFQWLQPGSAFLNSFDIVQNDPRHKGIDPQVSSILSLLPEPNNFDIGDTLNSGGYRFDNPDDSNVNQATLRVDHRLSEAQRLFARFSWQRISAVDSVRLADARYPGLPAGKDDERHWGATVGSDWYVSPTMTNQLRVGFQDARIDLTRPARVAGPMLLANSWTDPLDPMFARSHNSPVIGVADNVSMIRGDHALKAGASFHYTFQRNQNEAGVYPDVAFGRDFGNTPPSSIGPSGGIISQSDRQAFENLYNDLLGRMEEVSQTFYSDLQNYLPSGTGRARDFRFKDYGFFLQDDWKLRPNFTVNLGVRYELHTAPSESDGIFGTLDKAGEISATANIADFTLQRGHAWYSTDGTNFGPRVGLAWRPRNSTKTVIRGGYGIFYDRLLGAAANYVDQYTPATSQTAALFPNLGGLDIRLSDGIPLPSQPSTVDLTLPVTRSTTAAVFLPGLKTPRVQQFNLTVQQAFFFQTVLEAGYVGERGDRLFVDQNFNQLKTAGGFLQAFQEIQAFRSSGTPVPSTNSLARLFGSVNAAVSAIGGSTFDQGLVGVAADIVDRNYYGRYAAAGLSNFYLRNYPQFNQFIAGTNNGSSSFDSLQATLRRDSGPLRFHAHYTWGKSLDNMSADCCAVPLDSYDLQLNKGPSDFDRKRVFNAWVVYDLPFGKSRPYLSDTTNWIGILMSNWTMGLLSVWESGQRFSVSSGRLTARADIPSLADFTDNRNIGDVTRQGAGVFYFSPGQVSLFTFPVLGETGNSGRNSFTGPNYFNVDLSLVRPIVIKNDRSLTFRAEVYNILNRANFGLPDANLSDGAAFGKISSTVGYPRQIQLALRFDF